MFRLSFSLKSIFLPLSSVNKEFQVQVTFEVCMSNCPRCISQRRIQNIFGLPGNGYDRLPLCFKNFARLSFLILHSLSFSRFEIMLAVAWRYLGLNSWSALGCSDLLYFRFGLFLVYLTSWVTRVVMKYHI